MRLWSIKQSGHKITYSKSKKSNEKHSQKIITTSSLAVCSVSAFAQANDWLLPPSTKIHFNANGTISISTFSIGCGSGNVNSQEQSPRVISDSAGNGRAFVSFCGTYTVPGGTSISPYGYSNVIPVPGLCNKYYSVNWELETSSPPRNVRFTVRTLDVTNPTTVVDTAHDDLITGSSTGGSVAFAPLDSAGSRTVYFTQGTTFRSFRISANGVRSATTTLPTLSTTVNPNGPGMKVSPDGKKVLMDLLGPASVTMYNVATGTFSTLGSFSGTTSISGFAYVRSNDTTADRIYLSYRTSSSTSEGLGYVTTAAPTTLIDALPLVMPSGIAKQGFGYSAIERGKNGKLYVAYNANYTSHTVLSGSGALYTLDPVTGVLAAVMNGASPVVTNTFIYNRAFVIQSQIDGDANSYKAYSSSNEFSVNGKKKTSANIPSVLLCDADSIKLAFSTSSFLTSYQIVIRKGTVSADSLTFSPMGLNISSSVIASSKTIDTINLQQLFGSSLDTAYSGGLSVTLITNNGCGSFSNQQIFRLIRASTTAKYKAIAFPGSGAATDKANQTTLPITTPMPTGTTLFLFRNSIAATIGWMGAGTAGVDSIRTNGRFTLKVYEVVKIGSNIVRREYIRDTVVVGSDTIVRKDIAPDIYYTTDTGSSASTFYFSFKSLQFQDTTEPTANRHFFYDTTIDNQIGADYLKEYYANAKLRGTLSEFNTKTWCIDFEVVTAAGCTTVNKSYFRIATNAALSTGGNARGLPLGIEEEKLNELRVFPNPATDKIRISFIEMPRKASIQLFDAYGRIVVSNENLSTVNYSVDLKNLPAGIYTYRVMADDLSYHGKLLKK